jgi:hypothetical protein
MLVLVANSIASLHIEVFVSCIAGLEAQDMEIAVGRAMEQAV